MWKKTYQRAQRPREAGFSNRRLQGILRYFLGI